MKNLIELFNKGPIILFQWKNETNWPVEFVTDNVAELTGYSKEELLSGVVSYGEIIHPEDLERVRREVAENSKAGVARFFHTPYRIVSKDGTVLWVSDHTSVIRNGNGDIDGFAGYISDITEQRKIERIFGFADKLKASIDGRNSPINIITTDFRVIGANRKLLDTIKLTEEEVIGRHCYEVYHQLSEPCEICTARILMETGESVEVEKSVSDQDGALFYFKTTAYPIFNESGEISLIGEISTDITEQRRAEEKLRESEEQYRALFNDNHSVMLLIDPGSGNIIDANKAACKFYGYAADELKTMRIQQINTLTEGEVLEEMENARAMKKNYFLFQHRLADGTIRDVEVNSGRVSRYGKELLYSIIFDVTEKLKNEKELFKAQKLESVGLLAGGIAHDFNNILTGLFGNIELAKMKIPGDHAALKYLDNACSALERATNLTSQLLTFAKGGDPVLEEVEIQDGIQNTVSFNLSGSNVRADIKLPENLWPLKADKGQLSQVFANLVINARQAMPAGGTLFIDGENIGEESGDVVKINFRDQGVGISPQYLDMIFDPYFTTKQTGSGLGLATVHSIVKKHNGHISVESTPGEGTAFTLYLPADRTSLQVKMDAPSDNSDDISLRPGRALIMDDEEIVQMVVKAMLEALGYETESAYDGEEAVQKYQEAIAERPFSFVLLDLTIPGGMGGKEAAQKLLAIDPAARMIVYSGYSNDPVVARFAEYGFHGRLVKPFTLEELKRELKRLG
jgi:PAS domain S-box-containing protein